VAKIRIIEADAETRRMLELMGSRLGHEATQDAAPDVVAVEPAGPGALETLRELRARRPDLPVILVTVLPRERALAEIGAVRHLEKPVSGHRLLLAIEDALAASGSTTSAC
jgi:CheY-like chemotaxis protein